MTDELDPRLMQPDWRIMDVQCGCWRRNCRHQRELAGRRAHQDQLSALTDGDVAWLASMGWTGQ